MFIIYDMNRIFLMHIEEIVVISHKILLPKCEIFNKNCKMLDINKQGNYQDH